MCVRAYEMLALSSAVAWRRKPCSLFPQAGHQCEAVCRQCKTEKHMGTHGLECHVPCWGGLMLE